MAPKQKELRCPKCGQDIEDYALKCPACSLDFQQNDSRPADVLSKSINRREQSIFFYVSPLKLVVMSMVTFGLYELFWFYKNWCYVEEHTHKKMLPLIWAIFSPWTYRDLIREVSKAGTLQGVSFKASPFFLVACYFVLSLCGRLPNSISIVGILAPIPLIALQKYINSLNVGSVTPINSRFTPINWVGIVIGGVILILGLLSYLLPTSR